MGFECLGLVEEGEERECLNTVEVGDGIAGKVGGAELDVAEAII